MKKYITSANKNTGRQGKGSHPTNKHDNFISLHVHVQAIKVCKLINFLIWRNV